MSCSEIGETDRQTNVDGEAPEDIEGVGQEEQKRIRQYIVSKVGPRRE